MNDEELFDYLKNHLRITLKREKFDNNVEITVALELNDPRYQPGRGVGKSEIISWDSISIRE